jgi:hypothetical protein
MEQSSVKNNNKILVKNLPGTMEENEFRILTSKFNSSISYFKYIKPKDSYLSKRTNKSKCYVQVTSPDLVSEFIEEFNKPFFDSKGDQFLPSAELSFYQEVAGTVENNSEIYSHPEFTKFKENFEKGELEFVSENEFKVQVEKVSQLLVSIKNEALEENKKKEESKKNNKKTGWKNKNKKWKKK